MSSGDDVLRVRNLRTRFFTNEGQINAVDGVSFDLRRGEVLAIVGESGSGKSVTGRSVMGLIESPGRITDGELWIHSPRHAAEYDHDSSVRDGEYVDVRSVPPSVRRTLQGGEFSMIFQDPGASFNPNLTVGEQIAEAVESARRLEHGESYSVMNLLRDVLDPTSTFATDASYDRAVELLEWVDIPDPIERAGEYPHQFSGGMLQRAMIAQALASDPTVLIADEPTTGLDVTIQAEVLALLNRLQEETDMSIVLITHNLGVVSRIADRTAVMYAGEFLEVAPTDRLFDQPVNPYTRGLLGSVPDIDDPAAPIEPIYGNVPSLLDHEMTTGCSFAPRCPDAVDECSGSPPPTFSVAGNDDHRVTCVHTDPRALEENPTVAEGASDDESRGVMNE